MVVNQDTADRILETIKGKGWKLNDVNLAQPQRLIAGCTYDILPQLGGVALDSFLEGDDTLPHIVIEGQEVCFTGFAVLDKQVRLFPVLPAYIVMSYDVFLRALQTTLHDISALVAPADPQ